MNAGQSSGTPGVAARAFVGAIRGYQRFVSPLLASNCRYHPTCSAFAVEAIEVHGAGRGSWMAVKRIGRCHPFHEGGIDPVPGTKEELDTDIPETS